ncbi:MAG: outer membrane lipoprotein-sorting protein [Verrucomicrobiota bacterium]
MNRFFLLIAFLWVSIAVGFTAPNSSKQIPPPDRLQFVVWDNMILRDFTLEGVLRVDKKGKKTIYPITLQTKGRTMVYTFKKKPLQVRVQLTPSGSIVESRASKDQPWQMISGKGRLEHIFNSDVAYEDLGVDFLRWSNVRPLGEDSIKTLKAWAYEATPPTISQYSKAHYWISADYLSVLRVDAFNAKDQVVKRVEVNGVMQVGESYVIKEMMIASLIPGRELSKSRSYIQIKKATPGSNL